jgi:hypothetical protein
MKVIITVGEHSLEITGENLRSIIIGWTNHYWSDFSQPHVKAFGDKLWAFLKEAGIEQ